MGNLKEFSRDLLLHSELTIGNGKFVAFHLPSLLSCQAKHEQWYMGDFSILFFYSLFLAHLSLPIF